MLLALLLVPLLALSACGSSDTKPSNAYVDQVNRVQSQFSATFQRLAGQITTTSTAAQDRRTIDQFRTAVTGTVNDLRGIQPPAKVKALHAQLTSTLASFGTALTSARDQLGAQRSITARATASAALAEQTSRASADFGRTIDAINRKLHG